MDIAIRKKGKMLVAEFTAEAIAAAERCLAFGESYMALTMLALAHRVAGNYEAATRAFERAQRVDPDAALTIDADLGRIAWNAGDLAEARRRFEKVHAARRDDTEAEVAVQWLRHASPETNAPSMWGRVKSWTTGNS
jgi:tetratricopeptide (TPR) repeat protein